MSHFYRVLYELSFNQAMSNQQPLNSLNQLAMRANNDSRSYAFSKAIDSLRLTEEHIVTIEQAKSVKNIGGGSIGKFVVEAANATPLTESSRRNG